ncbi:MAG: hypothetical protein M1823_003584 [Watsoniomyces obsoletus]|nr:MAG: hypothetical protein M1823_003584 [Watsoniomyces obsoletus]
MVASLADVANEMFSGGHQERYPQFARLSSQRYSGHFETPQIRRSGEMKSNPIMPVSRDSAAITRPPRSLASTDVGITGTRTSHASPIEHLEPINTPIPAGTEHSSISRPPLTPERNKRFSATRSITRSLSPIKRQSSPGPTLTGDTASEAAPRNRVSGIAAWFQGTSAPMTLGISLGNDAEEEPEDPSIELDDMLDDQSSDHESPSPARRCSFLPIKPGPVRQVPPRDPRSDLDNNRQAILTLLDASTDQGIDQASMKRLRDAIEQHLLRYDASHRSEIASLQARIKDYEVLQEERDEAEARADLLKAQLEAMAALVAEKEQLNKDLMNQLTLERERRAKEEEARKRSIMLVRKQQSTLGGLETHASSKMVFESRPGSATMESDQGYYSDASSSRSPRISAPSLSPGSSRSASPDRNRRLPAGLPYPFDQFQHDHLVPDNNNNNKPTRPPFIPRLSTFQKVLLGLSVEGSTERNGSEASPTSDSMKGPSNSSTSSAVKSLRAENKQLQDRIVELEKTVESCLSVIGS